MTVPTLTLADLIAGDARARLSSLLSPRATVVVSCQHAARLPVAVLAIALDLSVASGGFLRLEGLTPHVRLALQVVDPERRLGTDDASRATLVGERPFQVRLGEDGKLGLVLSKGIGLLPQMNEASSYEWIRGLDASVLEVDLSHVEHLNSLLVAWLLQLNQGAGPGRTRLIQVGRQAVAQLTQLRLNHLLSIG